MLRGRWKSWWWDAALLAGFDGITWLVAAGVTHGVDLAVRDWCDAHRPDWAYRAVVVLNHLGQGWLLTWVCAGGLTAYLLISRRDPWFLAPLSAAYLLTGMLTKPIKLWTDRAAPSAETKDGIADPVLLFHYDAGESYPSGHVVNAIVWWGVIILLARRIPAVSDRISPAAERWIRLIPPAVTVCTTTYLSFHWVTDGLAGVLLGLFIWRSFLRLPWARILPG